MDMNELCRLGVGVGVCMRVVTLSFCDVSAGQLASTRLLPAYSTTVLSTILVSSSIDGLISFQFSI